MDRNAHRGLGIGPRRRAGVAVAILPAVMALTLAACGGGGGGSGGGPTLATPTYPTDNIRAGQVLRDPRYITPPACGGRNINDVPADDPCRVRVAVADSAFDAEHPLLRDSFAWNAPLAGQRRTPKYGLDLIDEKVAGDNGTFVYDNDPTTPPDQAERPEHGTHVSGIIAARDNGQGVSGVAPHATLVPIRLLNDKGASNNPWFNLGAAIDHAAASGAFIVNNSWGVDFSTDIIEIEMESARRFFLRPRVAIDGRSYETWLDLNSTFQQQIVSAVTRANTDSRTENNISAPRPGLLVVFAAGNTGWNSERGTVATFKDEASAKKFRDGIDDEDLDIKFLGASALQFDSLVRTRNLPDPLSAAFLKHTALKGYWLAVVATDNSNRIAVFSNGCGEAASYCLAAPGHQIKSTVPGGGFKVENGTSMAAPVVSGAAAVLKQVFPDQPANAISKILLCTATDLDRTEGRPTKSIEECAEKGPEATHANGWTPSEVYGHGLVNLARALQPIGPTRAAAADAFGIAPTADTRVAFSAAFGDAAPSAEHHFGGFDSLGRVYRFRAPLQDRVMPGPRLAGMLAATTPPEIPALGRSDEMTTLLRRSASPDSALGDGQKISFLSARHRTDLSFISARHGGALSPAALLRRDGMPPLWDSLAPRARDIIASRSDWRLADGLRAGIFFTRARMKAATRRGEAYSIRDYGLSGRLGADGNLVEARFGRLSESGRFLGSKPEGGYALARPTESTYLRLSASRRLTRRLSVGADLARLRSRVDFRHDAFVQDTVLRAGSSSVHLAFRDAAIVGDRLVLQHGRPLAVTGAGATGAACPTILSCSGSALPISGAVK